MSIDILLSHCEGPMSLGPCTFVVCDSMERFDWRVGFELKVQVTPGAPRSTMANPRLSGCPSLNPKSSAYRMIHDVVHDCDYNLENARGSKDPNLNVVGLTGTAPKTVLKLVLLIDAITIQTQQLRRPPIRHLHRRRHAIHSGNMELPVAGNRLVKVSSQGLYDL